MTEAPPFETPPITDEDIHRVCDLLGLPGVAFCGDHGRDPRAPVLKCMEPIDVAACPGSGKTTLLVAKLAILAENWPYRTRGICVLSHTNAARKQIEERLGNTTGARGLLTYPHYVGTIHGFVDKYLAIPWLRSNDYAIKRIDTDVCKDRRWWKLDRDVRHSFRRFHDIRSKVTITSLSFDVHIPWGRGVLKPGNDKYKAWREACRLCAEEGYFCYEDMFVFAHDLMERVPGVVRVIRDRFPLLFMDEVQDNSGDQSAILSRIFMDGGNSVIRQRLGDPNQAIFDSIRATDAKTDPFPDQTIKTDLPNSHRFGQKIAHLADPLGLMRYPDGLVGEGPKKPLESGVPEGQHTVFLFGDGDARKVLPAYGDLLIATFSERELVEGVFTAIGHIHRPPNEEKRNKYPHHVGHYWPDYDPQLTTLEPQPRTLVQYILVGMGRARTTGEAHHCVEKIAEGILCLAGMVEGAEVLSRHAHRHRYLRTLLEKDSTAAKRHDELLVAFAVGREAVTEEAWREHWRPAVCEIIAAIAGCAPFGNEAEELLNWAEAPAGAGSEPTASKHPDNLYRHVRDGREVGIRVGSIHSAKGETHTATLVLETFWNKHNLEALASWLTGEDSGSPSNGVKQQRSRLKAHYVAMTRPTHLLCLAMRRDAFEDDLEEAAEALRQRGWQVRPL